jgi:hypothetical protein
MLTVDFTNIAYTLSLLADLMPERKIDQIKAIRSAYGLGLKEAKDLVEAEWIRREPTNAVKMAINRMLSDRRFAANERAGVFG